MNFILSDNSNLKPIFEGNERIAYRDPTCCYSDGVYHLFMTVSTKKDGYMYNRVAKSESRDLLSWSEPVFLTPADTSLNYCSPGNVISANGEYLVSICSYPMPFPFEKQSYANEDARLFLMRTKDFKTFTEPEMIMAKGDMPVEDMGRMIDPCIFRDKDDEGLFHLMFKQNGVSLSHSRDLCHWSFDRYIDGGENASVVVREGKYFLMHSPENGIGIKASADLVSWQDEGVTLLGHGKWEWATGRLTAGYIMEAPEGFKYRYIVFFHSSRKEEWPETHGGASVAMVFTNDLESYFCQ